MKRFEFEISCSDVANLSEKVFKLENFIHQIQERDREREKRNAIEQIKNEIRSAESVINFSQP